MKRGVADGSGDVGLIIPRTCNRPLEVNPCKKFLQDICGCSSVPKDDACGMDDRKGYLWLLRAG